MDINKSPIQIDNFASERSIRTFCIGKKNWMFHNTAKGKTGCESLSGKQIHYTVKVYKAVIGPDVCNVSTPDSVWTLRIKLFIKNVMKFTAKVRVFCCGNPWF